MASRKILLTAALSALAFGLAPAAAFAGEVTGNGEPITINANSECAYSGLEDGEPGGPGVAPQNWGQIPKEFRDSLTSIGVRPSTLCNGHLNPIK